MYVPRSVDDTVNAMVGVTTVIAQFIGRRDDLRTQVVIPDGVNCNSTVSESSNCVFADATTESEVTMTCTVTPLDEGEKIFEFRRPSPDNGLLASVTVTSK